MDISWSSEPMKTGEEKPEGRGQPAHPTSLRHEGRGREEELGPLTDAMQQPPFPKNEGGVGCVCLRANEVVSNRRCQASGKKIVGQMCSFFSRIIKLADERNTLDIMNLAFSRALERGLHRCLLNSLCAGLEKSWHHGDPPWEGLGTRRVRFHEHPGQARSWGL